MRSTPDSCTASWSRTLFNMGYLGVKTMVDNLLGRTVEKKIDTGVMLVTKENMESPEVKTLLRPPLDQYLK